MRPDFQDLSVKKLSRERLDPWMPANVVWQIFGMTGNDRANVILKKSSRLQALWTSGGSQVRFS